MTCTEYEAHISTSINQHNPVLWFQNLQAEFNQNQAEVDKLNQQATEVTDQDHQDLLQPTLLTLNHRWREIQTRMVQYRRQLSPTRQHTSPQRTSPQRMSPQRASPQVSPLHTPQRSVDVVDTVTAQTITPVAASQTEVAMETEDSVTMTTRVVTTTVTSTTTKVSRVVFADSNLPAQYIYSLQEVIAQLKMVEQELKSPALQGLQYEDFSSQDDKLKVGSQWSRACFTSTPPFLHVK